MGLSVVLYANKSSFKMRHNNHDGFKVYPITCQNYAGKNDSTQVKMLAVIQCFVAKTKLTLAEKVFVDEFHRQTLFSMFTFSFFVLCLWITYT